MTVEIVFEDGEVKHVPYDPDDHSLDMTDNFLVMVYRLLKLTLPNRKKEVTNG